MGALNIIETFVPMPTFFLIMPIEINYLIDAKESHF